MATTSSQNYEKDQFSRTISEPFDAYIGTGMMLISNTEPDPSTTTQLYTNRAEYRGTINAPAIGLDLGL